MASNWRNEMSYLTPSYETSQVGDQQERFYAVSAGMLFKLRTLAKPVAAALTTLLTRNGSDEGSVHRQVGGDKETVVEAIRPDLAALRAKQKQEAVEGLIEAVMAEGNLAVLGEIVIDSMREKFLPDDRKNHPPAKEFINAVPAPIFTQMLIGVAKANKDTFGPLAGTAGSALDLAAASLNDRLKQASTPGKTSKTESHGSQNEATDSTTS